MLFFHNYFRCEGFWKIQQALCPTRPRCGKTYVLRVLLKHQLHFHYLYNVLWISKTVILSYRLHFQLFIFELAFDNPKFFDGVKVCCADQLIAVLDPSCLLTRIFSFHLCFSSSCLNYHWVLKEESHLSWNSVPSTKLMWTSFSISYLSSILQKGLIMTKLIFKSSSF